MTRKGFFALVGTLALLLVVMVGAWSYSRGTVDSEGSLNISGPETALIGTPDFALGGPVVEADRGNERTGYFEIHVNTENAVNLTLVLISADSELGATVSVEGGQGKVSISPPADPNFTIGEYIVEAKLSATGTGFSADIDLDIPVEVKNAQIVANDDEETATVGEQIEIDVLSNDVNPDGSKTIASVDDPSGSATISNNKILFESNASGVVVFTYTAKGTEGETDTATVTVTVNEAPPDNPSPDPNPPAPSTP